MKTSVLTSILFAALFSLTSVAHAKSPKTLKPIHKTTINLNLSGFCNYLDNGVTHAAEGVYKSPDGRYVIALIKNDEKEHDYIGVVCAADNPYWEKGEVKFNFVLKDSTNLEGYYYNSKGDPTPVSFTIDDDSLKTNQLQKIDVAEVKASTLACF